MKRALWIALAVLVVGLFGLVFVHRNSFIDFPVYYLSGKSLINGRTDLYSPEFSGGPLLNYRYPPFFIFVFGFLGSLPYLWAAYIWYWVCVVSIVGCVLVMRSSLKQWQLGRGIRSGNHAVWIIALLAVGQYFVLALHAGNAHLLVVFLLFYSLHFVMQREDGWAALMMGLAISIKFFPVLMLPYFAIKRRWKFVALISLFLLVINILPATYFGFRRNAELLKGFYDEVILNQEPREKNAQINLSLKGELRRTFTSVDYSKRGQGTESTDTDYPSVNIASIPQASSDRIWLALSAALGLIGLIVLWKVPRSLSNSKQLIQVIQLTEAQGQEGGTPPLPGAYPQETGSQSAARGKAEFDQFSLWEPLEYGLVICLILIAGPFTAKMYFMILLWPVTFLASNVLGRKDPAARFSKYVLFVIAAANIVLPLIPGRQLQRLLLVIGTDFYLTVLLMLAFIWTILSDKNGRLTQRIRDTDITEPA